MTTMIIRSIIIYIVLLLVIRIMGKRQIAQMQPLDVVITLIIADLASIPMSDLTIPLLNGIIPLFVLTLLHIIITFIACKSVRLRKFINGQAIILVGPQGVLENNLKHCNLTIADVIETCRYAGYMSLSEVLYVIMETNGNISVIPKDACQNVTKQDLKIKDEDPPLPYIMISDGKLSTVNLVRFGIDESTLNNFLASQKTSIKDVIVMQYDKTGKIFLQTRDEDAKVLFASLGTTQKNIKEQDIWKQNLQ